MANERIKFVESALKKGFAARGANVSVLTVENGYRNCIRIYVVADVFRGKTKEDRLDDVFLMLAENGAKNVVAKISLCIAMTKRECEREFGSIHFLGPLGGLHRAAKRKPGVVRLRPARARR